LGPLLDDEEEEELEEPLDDAEVEGDAEEEMLPAEPTEEDEQRETGRKKKRSVLARDADRRRRWEPDDPDDLRYATRLKEAELDEYGEDDDPLA